MYPVSIAKNPTFLKPGRLGKYGNCGSVTSMENGVDSIRAKNLIIDRINELERAYEAFVKADIKRERAGTVRARIYALILGQNEQGDSLKAEEKRALNRLEAAMQLLRDATCESEPFFLPVMGGTSTRSQRLTLDEARFSAMTEAEKEDGVRKLELVLEEVERLMMLIYQGDMDLELCSEDLPNTLDALRRVLAFLSSKDSIEGRAAPLPRRK